MCPTCGKKHNGLLHFEKGNNIKKSYMAVTNEGGQNSESCQSAYTVGATVDKTSTLLATALVRIKTSYGWSELFNDDIHNGKSSKNNEFKTNKKQH